MKRVLAAVTAFFCVIALASCGQGETASSSPESSNDSPAISVAPILEVELDKLLSVEQITEIVGTQVGAAQIFEDGTWVRYSSEDYKTNVNINMQESTEELFNTYIELYYPEAVNDEESGEHAKWSAQDQELVVLAKGYMIGINVEIPGAKSARLQQCARDLMNALVTAIPA